MAKEVHDVVNLLINDISQNDRISRPGRVSELFNILFFIMNFEDENLISKEEFVNLKKSLSDSCNNLYPRKKRVVL